MYICTLAAESRNIQKCKNLYIENRVHAIRLLQAYPTDAAAPRMIGCARRIIARSWTVFRRPSSSMRNQCYTVTKGDDAQICYRLVKF